MGMEHREQPDDRPQEWTPGIEMGGPVSESDKQAAAAHALGPVVVRRPGIINFLKSVFSEQPAPPPPIEENDDYRTWGPC
jgi:hypothetical protein